MQKWIIVALTLSNLVFAGLLLRSGRENRRLQDTTQVLTATLSDAKQQQEAATATNAALATQTGALKARLAERQKPTKLASLETSAPPAAAEKGGDGKAPDFMGKLAEMMENPEMKEAMRAQQKTVLSMIYGALFKKLQLTPEQLDQLKTIQLDKQMASMTMMLGKGDKTAQMAALTEAQKQAEQAVKDLLGDEQYAVYQDYEATVGERMAISQLNQQLSEKNMALDDVQQEEFVTLMTEERVRLKVPSPLEQQAAWAGGTPSSETFEKLLQQQTELNQRVYARSREVLTEAQQVELKAFQDNQIQVQRLGIQMMNSFGGGEKEKGVP
jgi:hypothetical protein